jgi:hypothetical protein
VTIYNYCESWNQRIAEAVCAKRLAEGKCSKDKRGKCREVRIMNLSDEERAKRSERMKNLRKKEEENGNNQRKV